MNKLKHKIIISALIAVASLSACKTTEANYRAAYQTAKESAYTGVDSTVFAQIRRESVPVAVINGNDTIRMRSEHVKLSDIPDNGSSVPLYSIIVGQFKQIFNAKAMCSRLKKEGFDHCIVIETREPLYYVVANSADNATDASGLLKEIESDKRIALKAPFPWILKRP